ncbi:MAG TPA: hypothetical protein VFJ02_25325, partial [Vicinamibacterales bacterium]|nr:hypothetical protein [Vicinamibacterales bacterium]
RAGNEFLWDSRPTFITMLTLGFYVRPWIRVEYPDIPSVGHFEATYFNPKNWKPEYPNTAFANARADDLFWAARILAALSEDGVRAVVRTAQYSDPRATEYLTETLLARRTKVLRAWLNATNPIVEPALDAAGALTFTNAAHRAGVGKAAERYTIQWSHFDNAAATHTRVGSEQTVTAPRAQAPGPLLAGGHEYIAATVRAFHADFPQWAHPVQLYFRRADSGWSLAGLERVP